MRIVWTKSAIITLLVIITILIIVGLVGFRSIEESQKRSSDAGTALLTDADDTTKRYETLLGERVTFDTLLGQVIYINSWASWSPLSRDELIALNEVAGREANQDVHFIALNRKETKEQADRLATLPPLPHLTIIVDTEDHFYTVTGGYSMPETVIYRADGSLFLHERTPQTIEQMQRHVDAVRAE
jgi:thiol-disulfide isomerase/thioredoxin